MERAGTRQGWCNLKAGVESVCLISEDVLVGFQAQANKDTIKSGQVNFIFRP